jgi:hypothetical protein
MGYDIVRSEVSEEKIKAYSRLLSQVFPETRKFTPLYIDWQYKQNPVGTVVGCDAFFEGKLVAHYVTIPVVYNIEGKKTKGLLSLNTATHVSHQGKGLFTKLANKTYENGAKEGYEFVIGVANQNSTPGFLNKLGFELVSPLEVKIGVGELEIWSSSNYLIQADWTKESLQWRLSNPTTSYFTNGNTIVAETGKFGILAQIHSYANGSKAVPLKKKNSPVKIWMGMAQAKTYRGVFIDLPSKLKPSPLNLIFKNLSGKNPEIQKEDIFFELIDFDAY